MRETLEVEELIDMLDDCFEMGKKMKSLEKPVKYDFTEEMPTKLCSWRGIYSQLTLDYGGKKELLLKDLLKDLKTCTNGKVYRGYKGGDFRMNSDTPVWADAYGSYNERMIIGVENTPDFIVLKTLIREDK